MREKWRARLSIAQDCGVEAVEHPRGALPHALVVHVLLAVGRVPHVVEDKLQVARLDDLALAEAAHHPQSRARHKGPVGRPQAREHLERLVLLPVAILAAHRLAHA